MCAPRTRAEAAKEKKKREQARDRQRKRRANMSSRKKAIEKQKQRERYAKKKIAARENKKEVSAPAPKPKRYCQLLREIKSRIKNRRDRASLNQLHFVKELMDGKRSIMAKKNLYQRTRPLDTCIEDFYEKAAVNLPGKNCVSTISMKAKKVLTKTVKSLFEVFKQKYPQYKVSLATFSRRRPQYILLSSSRAFRQCLCRNCVNPILKVEKLNPFLPKDLRIQNVDDLVGRTLCSSGYDRDCVDRHCQKCGVSVLESAVGGYLPDSSQTVTWLKWEKTDRAPMDQVKHTGTPQQLMKELLDEVTELPVHLKTARWQRERYQELIDRLPEFPRTAVVTLDFAENYLCKFQSEVQSAHWSYKQVTILPSVLHYQCSNCTEIITDYVVAVSDDLQHDAAFAKKTLQDVLKQLEDRGVTDVHIFSDGCAAQFKSKLPFLHMTELVQEFPNIVIDRHFFGSGHGKSLCDSCGGVIKGCASRAVASGNEIIQSASDMHQYCNKNLNLPKQQTEQAHECHVKRSFMLYDATEIERSGKADDYVTLAGCRKIHHFQPTREVGSLVFRHLSCFCKGCTDGNGQCENAKFVGEQKSGIIRKKGQRRPTTRRKKAKQQGNERAPAADVPPPASMSRACPPSPASASPFPQDVPNQDFTAKEMARSEFFSQLQLAVQSAASYDELKELIVQIMRNKWTEWPFCCEVCENPKLDPSAFNFMTEEISAHYFPVSVEADGNCFCRSLSFLATGTEDHHTEVRVRLVAELVLNEDLYMDADYLCQASSFEGEDIITQLAQFAEEPCDQDLSARDQFRREVMAFRRKGVSCGLWEVFAACNLFQWTIKSVYPPLGEPPLRQLMNRTVRPRTVASREEVVMWTTNRSDMPHEYWVANHVIPLLPVVQADMETE